MKREGKGRQEEGEKVSVVKVYEGNLIKECGLYLLNYGVACEELSANMFALYIT